MGYIQACFNMSDSTAYEWAYWNKKRFRVFADENKSRSRGVTGNNVIADTGRIVIGTRYNLGFQINDKVVFRGKTYIITDVNDSAHEVQPQAMQYSAAGNILTTWLYLFEVGQATREQVCATPVFSLSGTSLTITCDTLNAVIYYTTDGTAPSSLSTKYTAPISTTGVDKVYAIALCKGYEKSPIVVWTP